ncbi:hypothetical protein NP493_503g02049 [Ridgeia piscesae]|uniref:Uncharacterized protein n=1 Tax=Ridgeia piscesae TaxID=27915 RepID=A0AAD9KX87_RIDPI|nr:hypothetical protein NP493_503g02049 [Ridgeia piscesae]
MDKAAPAVQAAKRRMLHFPRALGECSAQGSVYAKCVAVHPNIKAGDCLTEFQTFKDCFTKALKKLR